VGGHLLAAEQLPAPRLSMSSAEPMLVWTFPGHAAKVWQLVESGGVRGAHIAIIQHSQETYNYNDVFPPAPVRTKKVDADKSGRNSHRNAMLARMDKALSDEAKGNRRFHPDDADADDFGAEAKGNRLKEILAGGASVSPLLHFVSARSDLSVHAAATQAQAMRVGILDGRVLSFNVPVVDCVVHGQAARRAEWERLGPQSCVLSVARSVAFKMPLAVFNLLIERHFERETIQKGYGYATAVYSAASNIEN